MKLGKVRGNSEYKIESKKDVFIKWAPAYSCPFNYMYTYSKCTETPDLTHLFSPFQAALAEIKNKKQDSN